MGQSGDMNCVICGNFIGPDDVVDDVQAQGKEKLVHEVCLLKLCRDIGWAEEYEEEQPYCACGREGCKGHGI